MDPVLVEAANLLPVAELKRRGMALVTDLDPIISNALRDPVRMGPRKLWQLIDDVKYLETLPDNVLRGDSSPVTKITPDGTFPSSAASL